MAELIDPQVLKGFLDSLPEKEIPKKRMMRILEGVFETYGFVPIDTPALEYTEVLLGKGGGETDKQMFRFQDNGGRDVALRFDLTVPFARFMASNRPELTIPFKRYHMAKVWRGEKPQKGRFREFFQCDFDIVGVDSPSADFEILLVMVRAMQALGAGPFLIHFSHRGVFNRFLAREGVQVRTVEILRSVDKLGKIGREEVRKELETLVAPETAAKVLDFIHPEANFAQTLAKIERLAGGPGEDTERLSILGRLSVDLGLSGYFRLDPAITRGLDYYTGLVYETFLTELPQIGSVCSGGRYNNLAGLYSKEELPGVGASVGLDRLLTALEELGKNRGVKGRTQILILNLDEAQVGGYQALAEELRSRGLRTEVYPEQKKVASQFKYAEAKGIPFAVFFNGHEEGEFSFNLKNVTTGEQFKELAVDEAMAFFKGADDEL